MRDRVDAARHPAHHDHARPGDARGEEARRSGAVRRVVAAAHDSRRRAGEQCRVTPDEEQCRRIGEVAQRRRKGGVVGKRRAGAEAIQLVESLMARLGGAGADRRGGGAAEAGERGDGAVWRAQRGRRALERRHEGTQPRGPDPRDLRQRQVRSYLVPTPIRSDCHRVSSSSGTPAPVTAEIATTGAPAWVRIAGSPKGVPGSRSSFVSTTMCGLDESSGEYYAAYRNNI